MLTTAIFPGRYVQGEGALTVLGEELERLGRSAFAVMTRSAFANLRPAIEAGVGGRVGLACERMSGECSDEEIGRLAAAARAAGADVIVGIGGGKTIDAAKAAAHDLDVPVAIVPTIASTDAPTSAVAVIYTPEGAFQRYLFVRRNPDLVLVDTTVIANAPVRFLVAGMGDGFSTWFEADDCRVSQGRNMTGRLGPLTGFVIARTCYEVLLEHGVLAKEACGRQVVTPSLERVVEANTLLSGLGFESAGLAAAHAIHNGLTVLHGTHGYWHGEKVAIGTLALLFLSERPAALIDEAFGFCRAVGLPTTLAEIGLADVADADLARVAERACAAGETIWHTPRAITPTRVVAALRAVDAEGRRRAA